MRNIKIVMAQILCLDDDRAGNFVRIENAIREAKEAAADIICLPEMVILGWVNPDAHERACPIPGEDSGRLCELSKKYDIYLCAGLAEKDGTKLYDSAVLIDEKGEIVLKHRKINILMELMTPPYTPGKEVNAVETKFGKIGVLICADTHSDEILKRMAQLKPDLLLVPYGYAEQEKNWPEHGKELERVVSEAGRKTGAVVIGTNLVGEITKGPWKGRIFGGHSVAADKNGETLTIGTDRDRDIKIVTVNTG
ncbi:MAG: carbon-nitrogen hydrolase family protein [Phycisphaerae bacterium]|nr:carbon-nitrogen hydrolase family protein [Phycisphaerae bacterium]NIR64051.1 carbon-nitrogen hydrolase family protein [candidate division Zixibacteria bacterium]NIP51691.1 carbon-nitrogen hydrolase family protein [Phycisphaerae bacterium]NIS50851.1 carbon-nitrogen hydrolase family protein [Phycisphaerae bacterium]NIU09548.1 carbon-nitrogen hydrolase family protein [Phycisphaerae bacterium]